MLFYLCPFHLFFNIPHAMLQSSFSSFFSGFSILFPVAFLFSMQLCDPSRQQLGQHRRELGPIEQSPGVHFCACLCFCLYVFREVCAVGHTLACVHVHARTASSARSGFNWMIGTLLTLTVSVIQTLNCSHSLQQTPLLCIKASPLSPAR